MASWLETQLVLRPWTWVPLWVAFVIAVWGAPKRWIDGRWVAMAGGSVALPFLVAGLMAAIVHWELTPKFRFAVPVLAGAFLFAIVAATMEQVFVTQPTISSSPFSKGASGESNPSAVLPPEMMALRAGMAVVGILGCVLTPNAWLAGGALALGIRVGGGIPFSWTTIFRRNE